MPNFLLLTSADISSLGRIQKESLSTQTLMELLVSDLRSMSVLKDPSGDFLPYTRWGGVQTDCKGNVATINLSLLRSTRQTEDCIKSTGKAHTIDLKWIPEGTRAFRAYREMLEGPIETEVLPESLITFCVPHNHFKSKFCTANLPKALQSINIDDNRLHGSLDLVSLPKSLITFLAAKNFFSGSIDLSALPTHLNKLDVAKNQLSGRLSLLSPNECLESAHFEGNAFSTDYMELELTEKLQDVVVAVALYDKCFDRFGKPLKDDRLYAHFE